MASAYEIQTDFRTVFYPLMQRSINTLKHKFFLPLLKDQFVWHHMQKSKKDFLMNWAFSYSSPLYVVNRNLTSTKLSFFCTGPPTSASISGNTSPLTAGNSIALTCDVVGGNPATFTYVWTVGGTMQAETGQTLTLNPLTGANNGQTVMCTADNTVGTVSNMPAQTLDVQCKDPLI